MHKSNYLFINNPRYRKLLQRLASAERGAERMKNHPATLAIIQKSIAEIKAEIAKLEAEADS